MSTRLPVLLVALTQFGLASTVVLAEVCGNYPLTDAQAAYLQTQVPDIKIPEGDVPFVQR